MLSSPSGLGWWEQLKVLYVMRINHCSSVVQVHMGHVHIYIYTYTRPGLLRMVCNGLHVPYG